MYIYDSISFLVLVSSSSHPHLVHQLDVLCCVFLQPLQGLFYCDTAPTRVHELSCLSSRMDALLHVGAVLEDSAATRHGFELTGSGDLAGDILVSTVALPCCVRARALATPAAPAPRSFIRSSVRLRRSRLLMSGVTGHAGCWARGQAAHVRVFLRTSVTHPGPVLVVQPGSFLR